MVLEGSVRKQGDKVRITAQLIDASNGFHLWSETYDRELKDIFAIQDEIARAIGEQLKVKITGLAKPGEPGRGNENRGTKNLEAYDLYLRGMALWQIRREKELWMSIEMFEKAVAIDPAFAEAYAGQALAYAVIGDYSNRLPIAETIARARDFAERALALNPALTEPYAALANVAMSENRWPTADALLSRAIALRPSFATAYQWRGNLLRSTGALDEGLLSLERASELNPRSGVVAENHAFTLRTLGRDADAIARCKELLAFDPNAEGCLGDVALAELAMGNFSAARAALEKQAAIVNPSARAQGQELIDALSDRGDKHALALRYTAFPFNSKYDLASQNVFDTYDIPSVLMLLGEPELALANIERRANQLGGNAEWAMMLPALNPIRCEPRFIAAVQKLKTHDPHFTKVCGGKK